ncbi:MAG: hypothetical protein ACI87O_001157 [Planctomycetota bacterium]|jgi:hypothetical protein
MRADIGIVISRLSVLVVSGLLAGCTSVYNAGRLSDPAQAGRVESVDIAPQSQNSRTEQQLSAESSLSQLGVSVAVSSKGPGDHKDVVSEVQREVQRAVDRKGMLMASGKSDINIACDVRGELFDKSGNYYLYTAEGVASIVASTGRELDRKDFDVKGERKLGQDEAVESAGARLGVSIAQWAAGLLTPEALGLAVSDLTIHGGWLQRKSAMDEYARSFVARVRAEKGILDCRVMAQNYQNKAIRFRVVFTPEQFPEGLLNRLMAIDELKIKGGR